jgi:hypothetical protein
MSNRPEPNDNQPFSLSPEYDRHDCEKCVCSTCYEQEFCDRCSTCENHSRLKESCSRYEGAYCY